MPNNFDAFPKKRGRPKGSKNGSTKIGTKLKPEPEPKVKVATKVTKKTKRLSRKELALTDGWRNRLREHEIGRDEDSGEEFVYFNGLVRLAEEAGKISEEITHTEMQVMSDEIYDEGVDVSVIRSKVNNIIVRIHVRIAFDDGTTWVGSADAHANNCQKYKTHPTAMAETRALGRAFRRALGIRSVCYEEISDVDEGEMTGEINIQQIGLIEKLTKQLKIKHIDIISEVTQRDGVSSIKQLTYNEGIEASRILNERIATYKAKAKKEKAKK